MQRILLPVLLAAAAARTQPPAVPKSPAEYKQLAGRDGKFKPGDMAPDFDLKVMHKDTRVALSNFRNKRPVALIFGSYT